MLQMASPYSGDDYNTEFDAMEYLRCYRGDLNVFYKDILDDVHFLLQDSKSSSFPISPAKNMGPKVVSY